MVTFSIITVFHKEKSLFLPAMETGMEQEDSLHKEL